MKRMLQLLRLPKLHDVALNFFSWALVFFGSFMIIFTNVGTAVGMKGIIVVIIKQLVFIIAGYVAYTVSANVFNMKSARSWCYSAGVGLVVLLLLTFAFEPVNGSGSWIHINIGPLSATIQPSEFVKVYMIVMVAIFVDRYTAKDAPIANKKASTWQIIKVPIFWLIAFSIIIAAQKDYGALGIVVIITALCCLIPSSKKFRGLQLLIIIGGGISIFLVLFLSTPTGIDLMNKLFEGTSLSHITTRFANARNPFLDPTGDGHQPINGMYGFTKNGLYGGGLGSSVQKYGWLTQADNDYALAIIAEETGIFGVFLSVLCYGAIVWRLFYYAFKAKTDGEKIILAGVAMFIVVHFILNVGGVTGLIPLTGIPLLFLSSGGSSLLAIMLGLGICQGLIVGIKKEEYIKMKSIEKANEAVEAFNQ